MVLPFHTVTHIPEAHSTGHVLQLAVAVGGARKAVEGVVRNVELHHALAEFVEARGLCVHRHALCAWGGARGGGARAAFNLNQAEPAGAKGIEVIGRAELGDVGADHRRRPHNRGTLGHTHRHAVDAHHDHHIRHGPGGAEIL